MNLLRNAFRGITVDDWKAGVAHVILYAYAYQLCGWPMLFWLTSLLTLWTGQQWPAPPLLPWEHLATGTGTLAAIGGIETWREKRHPQGVTP